MKRSALLLSAFLVAAVGAANGTEALHTSSTAETPANAGRQPAPAANVLPASAAAAQPATTYIPYGMVPTRSTPPCPNPPSMVPAQPGMSGANAPAWMMPPPGVGAPANQVLPPWAQPQPTGAQPAGMPANPMMPPWLQPTAGATPPGAGATFNYPGATHQPGVAGTGPMVPANPMMPPWAQPQPQPQQPLPVGPSPANVALVEAAADSTAARMPSLAPREAVSTGGTGDVTMHPVSLS